MTNHYDVEKKAKKRVKDKKDFYAHLVTFISTMVFLLILNLLTSPGYLWVIWPALGWGIGLVSHYFKVFGFFGMGTDDWEEEEVEREMRKIKSGEMSGTQQDDDLELDEDPLVLKEPERMVQKKWNDSEFV